MTLLELDSVHAGYGGTQIVRDVSIAVAPGESVALLGRNGMGKTTLLRAIFGLADRSAGEVRIDGRPLAPRRPERLARQGLTLVPDDRGVFPRLTVAENLRLAASLGAAEQHGAPEQALRAFPELELRRDQPAGQLSGGLQQQLALARAFSTGARLIAVDELSQGIQPSIIEILAEELIRVNRELGLALLIVDQSPALALRICSRVVVLEQGRVVVDAASSEILAGGEAFHDLLVI